MKKFEVGMRVLCVKDHSQHAVKRGKEYRIFGMKQNECCGCMVLDVGISTMKDYTKCTCSVKRRNNDRVWWLNSSLFIPVEEFQQVTYTKIIEEIPMGVN